MTPPPHLRARVVAAISLSRQRTRAALTPRRATWLAVAAAATVGVVAFAATDLGLDAPGDTAPGNAPAPPPGDAPPAGVAAQPPDPDAVVYTRIAEHQEYAEQGPLDLDHESWWPVDGTGGILMSTADGWGTWATCDGGPDSGDSHMVKKPTDAQVAACVSPPGYVTDLPTDPDAMRDHLADHPRRAKQREPVDAAVFTNAWELLTGRMVAPEARATILEALASITELEVDGDVEMFDGRAGTAVAYTSHGGRRWHARYELIFDRDTDELIGARQTRLPEDLEIEGRSDEPLTIGYAVVERAIVDEMRLRPDGSTNGRPIEWLAWEPPAGVHLGFE